MPASVASIGDLRVRRLRQLVLGTRVTGVTYLALPDCDPGSSWPHDRRNDQLVHQVEIGIELSLDSGSTLLIHWVMPGSDEGLAIEMDATERLRKADRRLSAS